MAKFETFFKKTVLQDVYSKDVYKSSKKGEYQFNSAKLTTHLIHAVNKCCTLSNDSSNSTFSGDSEPVLVGKSIDHQFIKDFE